MGYTKGTESREAITKIENFPPTNRACHSRRVHVYGNSSHRYERLSSGKATPDAVHLLGFLTPPEWLLCSGGNRNR
jgi:hypothetical protein